MIGKVFKTNGGGGGSSAGRLNVFAQSAEPASKEGIWINTSATGSLPEISKFEYEGVEISREDYYNASSLSNFYMRLKDIPYPFYKGCTVSVGDNIFLLGSYYSTPSDLSAQRSTYQYKIASNAYTRMADIPYNFYDGSAVNVGDKIFLFGGGNSTYSRKAYVYDISTNKYSALEDIPFDFYRGAAVNVGDSIFLLGSGNSTYSKYAYEYKISNNAYTRLSDLPMAFSDGGAVSLDTFIYLFKGSSTYRYTPTAGVYSKRANIPRELSSCKAVKVGEGVRLFGAYNGNAYTVDYNPSSNTYSSMRDITDFNGHGISTSDTGVYLMGGASSRWSNYKMTDVRLRNAYIYLFTTCDRTDIQLTGNARIPISNAAISQNGGLKKYPAYYGDGTQWNLLPA